jgi:topoisomerase-4 subunit A
MAKKKPAKKNDQPELPLGGDESPAQEAKGKRSEASGSDSSLSPEASRLSPDSSSLSPLASSPADVPPPPKRPKGQKVQDEQAPLAQAYRNWFLDYASYVILDRAVPHLDDGLKPVQRRVLHTLWDMDDGRFHKVANVVGATMKLHPHGDASIGAALVSIGQRAWLIEPQGNYGNTLTGDDAAAPRYIEARLTNFAKDVLFNPKTTAWQLSYDGRNKEPITLPAKFPIVLLEGADGIAVGLSTKILPHNFNDLCRAAINHLQGKTFRILPDFPTGGTADFAEYNDGERGGKVKVRAKIEERSKYLLAITELPYGVTTESLIESILAANAKGKIKIKHVDDNTADKVEILIHLPSGSEPDKVIQQLYVFTSCQVQLNPAACVIVRDPNTGNDKPVFTGVRDILKASAEATKELLKRELEIKLGELEQQWHWDSLERIFIEERIYRLIEKSKTWESVLAEIRGGLKPFLKQLRRDVTDDDITRLTEIRIKRISAYNRFQADEAMKKIEEGIKETKANLKKLTEYAVAWFEMLQEKYGKGRQAHDQLRRDRTDRRLEPSQRQPAPLRQPRGRLHRPQLAPARVRHRVHDPRPSSRSWATPRSRSRRSPTRPSWAATSSTSPSGPRTATRVSTRWSIATAPKESATPRNSKSAASPATSCIPSPRPKAPNSSGSTSPRRKRTCPRASTSVPRRPLRRPRPRTGL